MKNGRFKPLEEIQFIGPGMKHLERIPQTDFQDQDDHHRWNRTRQFLGSQLWQQVRQAHILQIGCVDNGEQITSQWSCLGIRELTLVDPHHCEQAAEQLSHQTNQITSTIGCVTHLAQQLVGYNPDLLVRCFPNPLCEVVDRLQSRFDLIVTAVDDEESRLAASWLSRLLLVPHLDIITPRLKVNDSTAVTGEIRLLLPFQGCVTCTPGTTESVISSTATVQDLGIAQSRHRLGSTSQLTAMTAVTAIELWLSFLQHHIGSFRQSLNWNHVDGLSASGNSISPAAHCKICSPDEPDYQDRM
ncbi:ThiF family adenylyltransferase [Gimesia sp.]|uniref:ThiF family adenylyltransferase n=1 Tax=Gimesia sp. TaxID=2024833 RepID=UPI003A8E6D93